MCTQTKAIRFLIDDARAVHLAPPSAALGKSWQEIFLDAIEELLTHVLTKQMGHRCICLASAPRNDHKTEIRVIE